MLTFIEKTAWLMKAPVPYSFFHIAFSLTGIFLAVFLAWFLAKRCDKAGQMWVLFAMGVFLSLTEIYKQLFLYYIVNHGSYDWWYFPFQLCSTPMYLCLLLPFFWDSPSGRAILCTYLQDFGLLGGFMALLEPSGLFHPYWTLTLHGLLWHICLIFIGFFIAFSGLACRSIKKYPTVLPLFALFCLIATCINIATKGTADMFYISPYYPITQVVFNTISIRYGIWAGIMIYLCSICIGGLFFHVLMGRLRPRTEHLPKRYPE